MRNSNFQHKMKRLQIPQRFVYGKCYIHVLAAVDISKIYFLKNAKKTCKPNNCDLNRDWIIEVGHKISVYQNSWTFKVWLMYLVGWHQIYKCLEAAVQGCSSEKVYWKYAADLQENTHAKCNFIEISLRHWRSPVNLLHFFRTPFRKNTSGRLLLKCC